LQLKTADGIVSKSVGLGKIFKKKVPGLIQFCLGKMIRRQVFILDFG
jgi:hypothetical protein